MNFKKLLFALLASASFTISAQDQRRYNEKNSFWSEINLIGKISPRFNYQLDIQYRFQSEQQTNQPNANLNNPFLLPYQTVFRPWIHYYITKDRKFRFSASPIGFWATYGLAGSNGTTKAAGEPSNDAILEYPELRSTYQLTTYDKIGPVNVQYRARFEFRKIDNGEASTVVTNKSGFDFFHFHTMKNPTVKQRLRLLYRVEIPLKGTSIDAKEFYVAAQDEIFIGLGKKTANANFFDQNRAFAAIGYKTGADIRIEIGYLNQVVPQGIVSSAGVSTRNMDFNNVFQVYVYFDNFNKYFQKKKSALPEKS